LQHSEQTQLRDSKQTAQTLRPHSSQTYRATLSPQTSQTKAFKLKPPTQTFEMKVA
jgi:hypothetical protein